MRIMVKITTLLVACVMVSSCSNMPSFDTDKIMIHYGEAKLTTVIHIDDTSVINEIASICRKGKFQNVPPDKMLEGMCNIFIDFNNGTIIGMYEFEDYGNLESKIDPLGKPKYLPSGLNEYIRKIISERK